MTDPHLAAEAEAWLRQQAERGLGSRVRLRLIAITAWASFNGAVITLFTGLAVLPSETVVHAGLPELSAAFFLCWALAAIPAGIAVLLTHPRAAAPRPEPARQQGGDHGQR